MTILAHRSRRSCDSLEATLQEESELVLRSLRGAMNALRERDDELADEVIAFDDEVDARYLALEQGIESLLATADARWRSTSGSCWRSSTSTSTWSAWPTSA